MKRFEGIDLESINVGGKLYPIAVSITNNNKILYYKESIKNYKDGGIVNFLIENCKKSKIYYAHNLTFEAFLLIPLLVDRGIYFNTFIHNYSVYKLDILDKNGNTIIKLRCSWKLTNLSLKNLGKLVNIKKLTFPYKILNKSITQNLCLSNNDFKSNDEYIEFISDYKLNYNLNIEVDIFNILKIYCTNDSKIVKLGVIKFISIIKSHLFINSIPFTSAKVSVLVAFKYIKNIKKKLKKSDDEVIRKSYYGGRCEVFGNPKNDEVVLHFDFYGMYAQCMSEKVPAGECKLKTYGITDFKPGFYYIEYIQDMDYPILPQKINNKLFFVNGLSEGWFWFEEVIFFLENKGKVLNIKASIEFNIYDYELKKFIDLNNSLRLKGGVNKIIGKNNNNAFYGRMGINKAKDESILLSNINHTNAKVIREYNGYYLINKPNNSSSYSNVSISSSITSKARIKLYKGFIDIWKNGGRLLYCDTDSIIAAFNKKMLPFLLDKQIGELFFDSKKPDTILLDSVFALPKTYSIIYKKNGILNETTKIKGYKQSSNHYEFKNCFYNNILYSSDEFEINKYNHILKIHKYKKSTNLNSLEKRIWGENYKHTYPINIKDIKFN